MPGKAVVDAVEARLAAGWNACPVFGLNQQAEPPADGSPFLRVDYPLANSEQISIGAPGENVFREEGVFRVVIHQERGAGSATALIWSDQIAALFRGKTFDGVVTFAPEPSPLDDDNENGLYYTVAVAVPYQFDLLG